ncbi:hypothetical protein ACO0LC_04240 [Undibacterium sp. JH2W]|uniref:hypothetical protein n=1 Tax=Undibacterium sp. JH2W TaxID=3413037 RepID=UPI003BF2CF08
MFLPNFRISEFFSSYLGKWRSRWWHRFYLRVYLAIIASLLVTVLLIGIILHMIANSSSNFKNNMDNFSQIASDILPPSGAPAADMEIALNRWQQWMASNLSVYDGDGKKNSFCWWPYA